MGRLKMRRTHAGNERSEFAVSEKRVVELGSVEQHSERSRTLPMRSYNILL